MTYKRYIIKKEEEEPPSGLEVCISILTLASFLVVVSLFRTLDIDNITESVNNVYLMSYAVQNPDQALFTYSLINAMK